MFSFQTQAAFHYFLQHVAWIRSHLNLGSAINSNFTVEDMIFSCCSLILTGHVPPLKTAFLSI